MPHIKSPYGMRGGIKVFHVNGVCWKCGKDIVVGSLNWSYNTHIAGKYSHQDCSKTEDYKPEVKAPLEPKASDVPTKQEQTTYNASTQAEKLLLDALDKLKTTGALKPVTQAPQSKPAWIRPAIPSHHKYYDLMKRALSNAPRKAIYLAGAPGSSKTYSIMQYAEETGLAYYCVPLSETTTASDIFGYISPITKELVRTMFREWYQNGGILDLPEVDNSDPNVLTMINNAIDNGICGFPDGMIKRHEQAFLIANGNTDMRGPTSQFPTRRKLDAASVERFVFLAWDYDNTFEQAYYAAKQAHTEFITLVHKIRQHCQTAEIEIVVSQRAIRDGVAMLDAGFNIDQTLSLTLFKQHPQTEDIYLAIGRTFVPQAKLWSAI